MIELCLACVQLETFRRQVKQTACFASSLQSADDDDSKDDDDDDADVVNAIKQTVGERAKLKAKVQVSVTCSVLRLHRVSMLFLGCRDCKSSPLDSVI